MHPLLFNFPQWLPLLGGHGIHVYGLMIATAFLVGMTWIKHESKRVGLDVDKNMDLFFYLLISGLAGARIFYIINSVTDFWSDPLVIFRVWEGGLVFQGGVIAAVLVAIFVVKKYKMPFFKTGDVFLPAVSLGHGIGRIGCFFAGCCFGKQCDINFPFAVVFPDIINGIAPAGIPLYPTQLMEVFGEAIIFTILVLYRKRKSFDGAVFFLYIILYSILRSFVEMFRGDVIRGFIIDPYLSNGQFISIISIVISIFFWIYLSKKAKMARLG